MPLCSRTGHRVIRFHISLGFANQDHKGRVSVPVIVVLEKFTGTTELGFAQYRRSCAVVSGSARGQRRPSVRTADSSMATRRPRGHGTTYGQNRTVPVRAGRSTAFTARAEMCPTPVPTMGGRASNSCPADGSSSARSPGSIETGGWPRTSRRPSRPPRPGSSSPASSSSRAASQEPENTRFISSRTLSVLGIGWESPEIDTLTAEGDERRSNACPSGGLLG